MNKTKKYFFMILLKKKQVKIVAKIHTNLFDNITNKYEIITLGRPYMYVRSSLRKEL